VGQVKLNNPLEYALAILAAFAFIVIIVSGMAFLVLSAQRLIYRFIPESRKKGVFWIKLLEDREIRRYSRGDPPT
jgi:hypothetical protein